MLFSGYTGVSSDSKAEDRNSMPACSWVTWLHGADGGRGGAKAVLKQSVVFCKGVWDGVYK